MIKMGGKQKTTLFMTKERKIKAQPASQKQEQEKSSQ
jgi:hypothetical protein